MVRRVATNPDVKAAVEAIQRAWLIGRQILDEGRTIKQMMDEYKESYEFCRQCRKFAQVYSAADYNNLLEQIVKHQNALGYSFVWKFCSIADVAQRRKIQKACIAENWGRARLDSEILALRGRVKHGGRRRAVTSDAGTCMAKLDQEVDRWLRLADDIAKVTDDLPPAVSHQLFVVWKEVRTLRDKIDRALEKRRG
jgi:hypothetical protein